MTATKLKKADETTLSNIMRRTKKAGLLNISGTEYRVLKEDAKTIEKMKLEWPVVVNGSEITWRDKGKILAVTKKAPASKKKKASKSKKMTPKDEEMEIRAEAITSIGSDKDKRELETQEANKDAVKDKDTVKEETKTKKRSWTESELAYLQKCVKGEGAPRKGFRKFMEKNPDRTLRSVEYQWYQLKID